MSAYNKACVLRGRVVAVAVDSHSIHTSCLQVCTVSLPSLYTYQVQILVTVTSLVLVVWAMEVELPDSAWELPDLAWEAPAELTAVVVKVEIGAVLVGVGMPVVGVLAGKTMVMGLMEKVVMGNV